MAYYVGFDIGGTTVKYGLVNETGEILEKGSFVTTPNDGEQLIANMAKQVAAYQEKYAI